MSCRKICYLFFFLLLGTFQGFASHIVGGYIRYDCLGISSGNAIDYQVELVLYRDNIRGNPGATFTQFVPLTIFTNGVSNVQSLSLQSTKFIVDSIEDPCFVRIDSIQIQEGRYTGVVSLNRERPHLLVYQRCCRNNSIDNLQKPTDDWGSTWTIEVPIFNVTGCNSSPQYNSNPPVAFCPTQPLNIDLSMTDADGDSLVYSFCAPFTSPQFNPEPNPAQAPPYSEVQFLLPQTPTFPVPSAPPVSINSQTGLLTGSPTTIGQYVVGFCISEYRNGVLLSTSRRDIQINTANCNPVILSAVQDQTLLCDGRTVNFQNNTPPVPGYNIKGYFWDFGDPSTLADTSRLTNPSYTYPDTGLYTITLIANPGLRCSDTTTKDFLVYEQLNPQIEVDGLFCEDSNSIDFIAGGSYESYATISWNFGPSASISTSNLDTVRNVQFSGPLNSFTVDLQVDQDICTENRSIVIQLDPNPVAVFQLDIDEICAPFPVIFSDQSNVFGPADFIWSFGDGDSAFVRNPTHIYQQNGDYEVVLEVRTTDFCIDTVQFRDSVFASRSFSPNQINFDYSPKSGCPPLVVSFSDSSDYIGSAQYFWDLDNNQLSNAANPSFTYTDSGFYDIGLLLITADSCADTLNLRIDSAIEVLPSPQADLVLSKDSSTLKEATVNVDARGSRDYNSGEMFFEGGLISRSNFTTYTVEDTGHFQFSWIAENQFSCLDTALAEFFVYDVYQFEIPNIFTPNGDGVNDAFRVRACGVYDYNIVIYNRFGKEVYKSNSLLQGWDGYINDRKAKPGVYFYKIVIKDLNGEYLDFQGSLTLLYE
ncbi:MAG: hypothetical protein CMP59_09345 [Flavobacteriales bacterium]|nr:hypothetical protein [Flavobacteriales bacterium]